MAMIVGCKWGHTHPKRLRKPNISTNTPMVGHLRNEKDPTVEAGGSA